MCKDYDVAHNVQVFHLSFLPCSRSLFPLILDLISHLCVLLLLLLLLLLLYLARKAHEIAHISSRVYFLIFFVVLYLARKAHHVAHIDQA